MRESSHPFSIEQRIPRTNFSVHIDQDLPFVTTVSTILRSGSGVQSSRSIPVICIVLLGGQCNFSCGSSVDLSVQSASQSVTVDLSIAFQKISKPQNACDIVFIYEILSWKLHNRSMFQSD
jgi:hypothetical protein